MSDHVTLFYDVNVVYLTMSTVRQYDVLFIRNPDCQFTRSDDVSLIFINNADGGVVRAGQVVHVCTVVVRGGLLGRVHASLLEICVGQDQALVGDRLHVILILVGGFKQRPLQY